MARANLRVLVIEDELLVAMVLQDLLEELGYDVVGVARAGEEAVAMAARTGCDLAFIDVALSGSQDGIETAAQLQQRFGIRVVFMSGSPAEEVGARAGPVAPLGFLGKPYTLKDVESVLAAVAAPRDASH